ncbi:MAG TPA: CoA transferase [Lacipirellulaceae bacterium]|nr:CoA transferase [Lacipirellulaceae bacterium]
MTLFSGLRILDASSLLAAPLAASMLGDFGAEVIKIEDPKRSDPLRSYPPQREGVSLIHKVTNRNKQQIAIDLRCAEGQDLFRKLAAQSDVVICNFRVGTLRKWGLDYEQLAVANQRLIMLHLTAYGRTGPYADLPGFARVAEAFCGLMGITGFPDGPPIPAGYPVVDGLTGIVGALGISMALYDRERTGLGQLVDLSLYEGMLRILEDTLIGYDQLGEGRSRVGTANPYVAPNDIYRCGDGGWIALPISTDSVFERFMQAIGSPELARDPRFTTNIVRVRHRAELDHSINGWLARQSVKSAVAILQDHEVPCGAVYGAREILADPHICQRGSVIGVFDEELGSELRMQAPVPMMSRTPGAVRFPGRPKGSDTIAVLRRLAGLSPEQCEDLVRAGVIASS